MLRKKLGEPDATEQIPDTLKEEVQMIGKSNLTILKTHLSQERR